MIDKNGFNDDELFFNVDFDIPVPNTDPVFKDVGKIELQEQKPQLSKYEKMELASRLHTTPSERKKQIITPPATPIIDTVPRIITDIRPAEMICNNIPKITKEQIKNTGNIKIVTESPFINIDNFMQNGSQLELATSEEKAATMNFLQKWKLSSYSAVWQDLCGGIYKQITTGNNFVDFRPAYIEDKETGEKILYKWIIVMTLPQIKKCGFGGLVNKDGEFIHGYGDLLNHTSYKDLIDIFTNKKAEPALLAFKAETTNENGDSEPAIYKQYTPLHIASIQNGLFTIELDPFYFPLQIEQSTGTVKQCNSADARFLPNIAGCYSVCLIGHKELSEKNNVGATIPKATTINRYYSTMQGAWNFQSMLGIHLLNRNNRENIRVNKYGIYDLFGSYIFMQDGKMKGDFDKAKKSAQYCGIAMYLGLRETGLLEELANAPNAENIHIPAIDKPLQYIKDYDKALILKADSLSKFK